MKKIAIIGAGGINSWVVKHLDYIFKTHEFDEDVYIKIFDKDIIEEKNILQNNQNFLPEDVMDNKAEILGKRYNYDYENSFITKDNINLLEQFDDVIMGVDSHGVRKIIYEFCLKHNKYLLDLRAQGKHVSYFVLDHKKPMSYYNQKFFNNKDVLNIKGSCQIKADVDNNTLQNGNKIIAFLGIYGIYCSHLRNEELITNEKELLY